MFLRGKSLALMWGLPFGSMAKVISQVLCLLSSGMVPGAPRNFWNESDSVFWNSELRSSPLDESILFQGDILLPATNGVRNAIKVEDFLWPNGTIPYKFNANFTSEEEKLIQAAMNTLESNSCVKFVEKQDDDDKFIGFQKERSGCFATIGKNTVNDDQLLVNLQAPECFAERGIIEHELLHVVGLLHEQSRPDRDDYVTVHWCNIKPGMESNFAAASDMIVDTFDLPYDYSSIMHYSRLAFSKNGRPTITAKSDPNMALGQYKGPTESDFKKVAKMYNCHGAWE